MKGHTSEIFVNLPTCNPKTLLHNINSHAKFEEYPSKMLKIECGNYFKINQGPKCCIYLTIFTIYNPRLLLFNMNYTWQKKFLDLQLLSPFWSYLTAKHKIINTSGLRILFPISMNKTSTPKSDKAPVISH